MSVITSIFPRIVKATYYWSTEAAYQAPRIYAGSGPQDKIEEFEAATWETKLPSSR